MSLYLNFFFFKHKMAYVVRISVWSSDVCSSGLGGHWFVDCGVIICRMAGDVVANPWTAVFLLSVASGAGRFVFRGRDHGGDRRQRRGKMGKTAGRERG